MAKLCIYSFSIYYHDVVLRSGISLPFGQVVLMPREFKSVYTFESVVVVELLLLHG